MDNSTQFGSTTPVFDVPSLLDKSIDEVVASLGKPTAMRVMPVGDTSGLGELMAAWVKNGLSLIVNYNGTSRKVTDITLAGEMMNGRPKLMEKKHKAAFLKLGNLQDNVSEYIIEFLDAPNSANHFISVMATPASA